MAWQTQPFTSLIHSWFKSRLTWSLRCALQSCRQPSFPRHLFINLSELTSHSLDFEFTDACLFTLDPKTHSCLASNPPSKVSKIWKFAFMKDFKHHFISNSHKVRRALELLHSFVCLFFANIAGFMKKNTFGIFGPKFFLLSAKHCSFTLELDPEQKKPHRVKTDVLPSSPLEYTSQWYVFASIHKQSTSSICVSTKCLDISQLSRTFPVWLASSVWALTNFLQSRGFFPHHPLCIERPCETLVREEFCLGNTTPRPLALLVEQQFLKLKAAKLSIGAQSGVDSISSLDAEGCCWVVFNWHLLVRLTGYIWHL